MSGDTSIFPASLYTIVSHRFAECGAVYSPLQLAPCALLLVMSHSFSCHKGCSSLSSDYPPQKSHCCPEYQQRDKRMCTTMSCLDRHPISCEWREAGG